VNAATALTAAGQLAAAGLPAAGLTAVSHFGGGLAAVPPEPVAPRGPGALIVFGLLGLACLGLIAFAASRLLTPAVPRSPGRPAAIGNMPERPSGPGGEAGRWEPPASSRLPWIAAPPPPRHAAPRGLDSSRPADRDRPPL
jgi:hypothetical protein